MTNMQKFIRALDLVKAENKFSSGLVINKTGEQIKWVDFIKKVKIIEVFIDKDAPETLDEIKKAIDENKWIVLEIKDDLPAEIYAQLRLISLNNRMQYARSGQEIETEALEKSRVIATCLPEVLNKIMIQYPEFKSLFGPVIEV